MCMWQWVCGRPDAGPVDDRPPPARPGQRAHGVAAQIAKGLQAFHSKEMLHQDLRPENMMIDRSGTVKIIDFASAHVAGLTEGTSAARADAIVGTLRYTAPEYFLGSGGTAQSDMFSLAVLVYQMLTAQLPYGLQVPQVRSPADVKQLRYVPVRNLRPELPAWLERCCTSPAPATGQTPGGVVRVHPRPAHAWPAVPAPACTTAGRAQPGGVLAGCCAGAGPGGCGAAGVAGVWILTPCNTTRYSASILRQAKKISKNGL